MPIDFRRLIVSEGPLIQCNPPDEVSIRLLSTFSFGCRFTCKKKVGSEGIMFSISDILNKTHCAQRQWWKVWIYPISAGAKHNRKSTMLLSSAQNISQANQHIPVFHVSCAIRIQYPLPIISIRTRDRTRRISPVRKPHRRLNGLCLKFLCLCAPF